LSDFLRISGVLGSAAWAAVAPGCEHGRVFGDDLLVWLVLALGGAMVVGNALALVRPPDRRQDEDDLDRAPMARSLLFIAIGVVAAVWALASLTGG